MGNDMYLLQSQAADILGLSSMPTPPPYSQTNITTSSLLQQSTNNYTSSQTSTGGLLLDSASQSTSTPSNDISLLDTSPSPARAPTLPTAGNNPLSDLNAVFSGANSSANVLTGIKSSASVPLVNVSTALSGMSWLCCNCV